MKIATWNINSVRLRIGLVAEFLREAEPDVIALQETKSPEEKIPQKEFAALGYKHMIARGFKGYNGVLIASKLPFAASHAINCLGREDARHVGVRFENGVSLENYYVPAGGDVPDRDENEKFAHKLDFLTEMRERFASEPPERAILVGDLNVAPGEEDVWSHKQLLDVVSHTPIEVEHLGALMEAGGWQDVWRKHQPEGKLYSWWSYRARDWRASNRGRRLDHVWASSDLADAFGEVTAFTHYRDKEKPSDHVPVLAVMK